MKTLVMMWGTETPFSIGYTAPAMQADSGLSVVCVDGPDPEEVDAATGHPMITWVCLDCLLEEHPALAPGLDLAREHGVADLAEDGEWIVGDLSRLGHG